MKIVTHSAVPHEKVEVSVGKHGALPTTEQTDHVLLLIEDPDYVTMTWLTADQARNVAKALNVFATMVEEGVIPTTS